MQRRDARGFLEEVLKEIEGVDDDTKEKLLALVADKPGNKRAAKLAAEITAAVSETDE